MTTPVEESVEEYLQRLEDLYSQIQEWLREAGLAWKKKSVAMHEERSGQYQASGLLLHSGGAPLAEFIPIGADILGAEGRVDLHGPLDNCPIVYLLVGGPRLHTSLSTGSGERLEEHTHPLFTGINHEGWYALDDREPKAVRPLDHKVFLDLLGKVADYGEWKHSA